VVVTAQKAQADVLLHSLPYALPGWDAAAERRGAQDEIHSAAQARAWADGDFDADHGLAFDSLFSSASPHHSWAYLRMFNPTKSAEEGQPGPDEIKYDAPKLRPRKMST
jgi:hypothetical protein